MQNSFKSILEQANSVLILLPKDPTFDQVSGGLALFLAMKGAKDASIFSPTPMTVDFNRLVGVNKITQELGNKNLIVRFLDYQASDIERVSYDIEDRLFKLTVIPKTGMQAPQKEQVSLTYSGVVSDLIVLVGGRNESHYPVLDSKDLAGAKMIHIGIKPLNFVNQKQIISFVQPFSSITEVIANLLIQAQQKIDADIATNLIAGVEEGSNKFSADGVAAETFQLIAELMKTGGRRLGEGQVQPGSFLQGSIPGQAPQTQTMQSQPQITQKQPVFQTDQIKKDNTAPPDSSYSTGQGGRIQPSTSVSQKKPQLGQTQTQVQSIKQDSYSPIDQKLADQSDTNFEKPPKDWLEPKIYKGTSSN